MATNTRRRQVSRFNSTVDLKDMLERKIEDLSRLLAEERQVSRQNKMAVSRLQRELARHKSRAGKEQLSRELEQERMLRLETERRFRDAKQEADSCHARLEALHTDFRKMEMMVQEMVQYKGKIDQLKHEKSSLAFTYETNLQKFKGHITELEHENMVLLNDVKKLESQMSTSSSSSGSGGQDKYNLLLERLRMVEGENSSLVLENEQQRGQYEKCLDEIANQVVQALLAQKMLREECLKLQERVQDLETQNHQLTSICSSQISMQGSGSVFIGSLDSLHTTFSQQTTDPTGAPQLCSPPPWLQDRLPGDRHSMVSFSGSTLSNPDIDRSFNAEQLEFRCRTKIETEFPATPSSPKSKHVSIMERKKENKRSSSTSSLLPTKHGPNRQRTLSTSSLSRGRGLSLTPTPPTNDKAGFQNSKSTNHNQGYVNSGTVTNSVTLESSNASNDHSVSTTLVPSNLSNSNSMLNSSQNSQSSLSKSTSRIPNLPVGKTKEDIQLRRNSLKAEYSIRLGSQSPAGRSTPSPSPGVKPATNRSSSQASRSNLPQPGPSRLPSANSTKSAQGKPPVAQSKIPMVSSKSGKLSAKDSTKSNTDTNKNSSGKPALKLIPPKSPAMKHTGIRTTLKVENINKNTDTSKSPTFSGSDMLQSSSATSLSNELKTAYAINPTSRISSKKDSSVKPALPARGIRPVTHRADSHFPIMGLTTLNHTSPKTEEPVSYANVTPVSKTVSDNTNCASNVKAKSAGLEPAPTKLGNYFYDYSDEESDCQVERRGSEDLSVASTVSLDELLDRTLENVHTPLDSEFSSMSVLLSSTHTTSSEKQRSSVSDNSDNDISTPIPCDNGEEGDNTKTGKSNNHNGRRVNEGVKTAYSSSGVSHESQSGQAQSLNVRLTGKPDIVQDTEESEQRKLKKTLPVSEIPGSSMPGYRAKRPKSLILGAKEKKFLYCEYGSSSSSDNSDAEWSCKVSYAKQVKQQEIQSKVAKSVKAGEAKVIESPKSSQSNKKDLTSTGAQNTGSKSQLPKPSAIKKPSKIPPPIASKPQPRKSGLTKMDHKIPRPKSVEICVNTALSITTTSFNPYIDTSIPRVDLKETCETSILTNHINGSVCDQTDILDDVKVERSGSKDDGYSTMSSDIQPDNLEKFSDMLDGQGTCSEVRSSNLSLSSQASCSSEDRHSAQGSLGRVRAMKIKFELDNKKSDSDISPSKSTPTSPNSFGHKSPTSVIEQSLNEQCKQNASNKNPPSKLPKPAVANISSKEINVNKPKSAIPKPKFPGMKNDTQQANAQRTNKVEVKIPVESELQQVPKIDNVQNVQLQNCQKKSFPITNPSMVACSTPIRPSNQAAKGLNLSPIVSIPAPHIIQQLDPPVSISDKFEQLSVFDKIEFLKDPSYDSNSSLSDRGSDLTSLHISEDNMLSDIPEEKDGYESSVQSEHNSCLSLPGDASASNRKTQPTHPQHSPSRNGTQHHSSSSHHHYNHKFTTSLKRHWSSCSGLVRAARQSDYNKQRAALQSADYEELYGGCLNIETLLERSCSEADMYTRGDKPQVILMPPLTRSRSEPNMVIDEISVEERLQAISKQYFMQQISADVASADKDGECFTSFVDLLIQRGHVLQSQPNTPEGLKSNLMTVSNFSSQAQVGVSPQGFDQSGASLQIFHQSGLSPQSLNQSETSFVGEERTDTESSPLDGSQTKFNSQFYSLCNAGSNPSLADRSESCTSSSVQPTDSLSPSGQASAVSRTSNENQSKSKNTGANDKCSKHVKKQNEFDNISKQMESLSKTVNELHRSLTSLHSDVSDSGSESNEGDVSMTVCTGKEGDDYHWVEDDCLMGPYDGAMILGTSPFSRTGASCDWLDQYSDGHEGRDEIGGQEAPHPVFDIPNTLPMEADAKADVNSNVNEMQTKTSQKQTGPTKHRSRTRESNFDATQMIAQRLQQEEERLKSMSDVDGRAHLVSQDIDISGPLQRLRSSMNSMADRGRQNRLRKEDLHTTPEKDLDDTEHFSHKLGANSHGGSQDSLDDNIGVDSVMCHRLLGHKQVKTTRIPLDLTGDQFIRYAAPEQQAVAAFDFLQEMTSSHSSDQSRDSRATDANYQHFPGNTAGNSIHNACHLSQGKIPGSTGFSHTRNPHQVLPRRTEVHHASETKQKQGLMASVPADGKHSRSPHSRKKLRNRARREQMAKRSQEYRAMRTLSSTSNDESNDDLPDVTSSDDEAVLQAGQQVAKKMTYL